MSDSVGSAPITDVRVGATPATKMYVGDALAWTPGGAPAYNPLTAIPWVNAYWAGGPAFSALGLADGANVTSWPSEVGTVANMASIAATHPTYTAAVAALGNKPAVSALAGLSYLHVAAASIPQPWSVVVVYQRIGGNSNGVYAGANGAAAGQLGFSRQGIAAGTNGSHTVNDGPVWAQAVFNGAASEVWFNNVLDVTVDAGLGAAPSRTALARTATPSNPHGGHLSFVGYLNRGLTVGERNDFDAWVLSHYGV